MGIKHFTTYVKEHFSVLYTDEFHLRGQKLVFDGGALYYGLFRTSEKRFGGDYHTLSTEVFKAYFDKLRAVGVTPYIVLDGGSNIPIKNGTICERFERDVKALRNLSKLTMSQMQLPKPALLKMVFIEALIELGIHFVLAKGEADMLVAALANRLGCPLVSGDSDFFVVDVLHGVIPMDPLLTLRTNMSTCVRYRSCNLARHLKLNKCLLPMVAVILGNDYSEEEKLNAIQMHCGVRDKNGSLLFNITDRVNTMGVYLRQFQNVDSVVQHLSRTNERLATHIRSVLHEFDLVSVKHECDELYPILTNLCTLSQKIMNNDVVMNQNTPMEMFLKHLVYHGLANPCLLDIYLHNTHFIRPQCEDTSQKSSAESAEKLRSYLYCLLLYKNTNEEVKVSEFKRKGDGYSETQIHISITQWLQCYPVDIVKGQYNKEDKIKILCKVTAFPMETLKTIHEEDHIFLISLKYWIEESSGAGMKLDIEHVQSLIIAYIHLKTNKILSQCTILEPATAHHYCRWQSILFYLILLNVVFRYPFAVACLNRIYQGTHVHHLYHSLKADTNPYNMLSSKLEQEMYNVFMNAVTSGGTSSLIYKQQRNRKRDRSQQQPSSSDFRQQNPGNHSNRFAMLANHDGN